MMSKCQLQYNNLLHIELSRKRNITLPHLINRGLTSDAQPAPTIYLEDTLAHAILFNLHTNKVRNSVILYLSLERKQFQNTVQLG